MTVARGHICVRRKAKDGADGRDGQNGQDAHSPYVGDNGNWFFYDDSAGKYVDSGRSATGDDGHSPYVGTNGNWYEYNASTGIYEDTGIAAKGERGEKGATLRGPQAWSDVAVGYSFEAGGEGEKWKDVVLYEDNYYVCISSHTKTSSNYPGSTAGADLWELGYSIDLVATKILLATYALVKNLGVEAIDMKDSSGNILFQAKDGNVICKTGTFNNVTVESGQIAGFKISGNGLTNDPFTNDAYIVFRNDARGAFAGIGGNVMAASSGVRAVARFENHDTTGYLGVGANYGMLLSARGATTNVALQMDGGSVRGFAMGNTIVSAAKTLARSDYNVIAINTSDVIITLPSMQLYDDGHVIRFKRLGSGALSVRTSYCYTYNGSSSRYSRPCIIYNQNDTITGTDTLSLPSQCDSFELVWVRDLSRTVNGTTYYGAWIQYKLPRDW